MTQARPTRLGIMGFGQIGRQVYDLAARSEDIEVVAIADIARPDILHYLLGSEVDDSERYRLEGNFLVCGERRARVVPIDLPREMPWDIFDVDMVIDATGKYRHSSFLQDHLGNGANRVLLRTLPQDKVDRIVLPGINEGEINGADRMISAGSATTTALALLLSVLGELFEIECATMTSVHAYTSDQALQDYAGSDYRRSRSAAQNIIPNNHDAATWIGELLPQFKDKVLTSTLNVPIHEGCLLDTNLVFKDASITPEAVNTAMREAAARRPELIGISEDPIVSSDVIGSARSLLFDIPGTLKAGDTIIKTLGWYETLGHAARMLDVVRLYAALDASTDAGAAEVRS